MGGKAMGGKGSGAPGRSERGSVLMLVPAGFLVLLLLAALAVDSAVAYQAHDQLRDAVSAAANDSVAAGLDSTAFYSGAGLTLDPGQVDLVVCRAMAAQDLASLHGMRIAVAVSGAAVRVTASASVNAVFGRIVPGFGTRAVRSSSDAVLAGGGPAPPPDFGLLVPVAC